MDVQEDNLQEAQQQEENQQEEGQQEKVRKEYPFKEGDKVAIVIEEKTPLGHAVFIENEFDGLLYNNEIFQDLEEDMEVDGYVKKIREDGKIDIALRPQGFRQVIESDVDAILAALENTGELLLTDKSSPEAIKFQLQLSKKAFKRAVGSLYKQKMIVIESDRIVLVG